MVLTCFFARVISLSLMLTILNLSWRNVLGIWSISFVPLINLRTLFWNFCSLSRWHFLLLIDGSGAYSNDGLIMLLYSVRFTFSGALWNRCIDLKEEFAFLSRPFIWWLPYCLWSVLYPRMLVVFLIGMGAGLLLSIITNGCAFG